MLSFHLLAHAPSLRYQQLRPSRCLWRIWKQKYKGLQEWLLTWHRTGPGAGWNSSKKNRGETCKIMEILVMSYLTNMIFNECWKHSNSKFGNHVSWICCGYYLRIVPWDSSPSHHHFGRICLELFPSIKQIQVFDREEIWYCWWFRNPKQAPGMVIKPLLIPDFWTINSMTDCNHPTNHGPLGPFEWEKNPENNLPLMLKSEKIQFPNTETGWHIYLYIYDRKFSL